MKTRSPQVTIGIPVFNGERYLSKTLDSLLNQTFEDFELIISDNASTDFTEPLCRNYAEGDQRIRYYRNRVNVGMASNYARVFELRRGEYFKWAAADDLCMPEFLSRCIEVLQSDSTIVLAYARASYIDENGRFIGNDESGWSIQSQSAYERLRQVIYIESDVNLEIWSGLARADAVSKTRLMPNYPCGDKRTLGEISLVGKIVEIPERLYIRRHHAAASSCNTTNPDWMKDFFKTKKVNMYLPTCRLCLDHFFTVIRSNLDVSQKCSLTFAIGRSLYWSRALITKELRIAAKDLFRWMGRARYQISVSLR
jgi:glycosyltransferase involved in cell wall biosynthesis